MDLRCLINEASSRNFGWRISCQKLMCSSMNFCAKSIDPWARPSSYVPYKSKISPLSSSISSRPRPPSVWTAFIIFACLFGKVLFLLRLVWLFNIQDIEHPLVLKMIVAGSVYQMWLLVGLNIVKVGLWLYALVWSWMGLANLAHLLFPFIFFYCLSSATPCFLITSFTLSSFLSQSSSVPPVPAPCLRSCRVRSSS